MKDKECELMQERKKFGVERFAISYFKNFHKIILCNVIFAIPLLVFGSILYMLNNVFYTFNIVIISAVVFLCYPFYSGVTMVTRNIMRGDEDVNVIKTFIKGFKENWLKFTLHGFILFLAVLITYFSALYYYAFGKVSTPFYVLLVLVFLIATAISFAFFYIPLLTVTFKLSIKNIYKNSFLMSFGELKNNFFALLGLLLLALVCFTFTLFATTSIVLAIILITLMVFIVPATFSAIVNFAIYNDVIEIMSHKEDKESEIKDAIDNVGKKKQQPVVNKQDLTEIKEKSNGDADEYIFHNGKMIKRSVIIRELNNQENLPILEEKKDEEK